MGLELIASQDILVYFRAFLLYIFLSGLYNKSVNTEYQTFSFLSLNLKLELYELHEARRSSQIGSWQSEGVKLNNIYAKCESWVK